MTIFDDEGDYAAFEKVMQEAIDRVSMRLLAYCVLSNHLASPGRRFVVLYELVDSHPHPALSCAST